MRTHEDVHVVVIGSTIFDLVVNAPRLPRQGEVMLSTGLRFFHGGKGANRAVAAARLGAEATLLSAVGEDTIGDFLLEGLRSSRIDTRSVKRVRDSSSGCSWIALLPSGNNATFVDPAANFCLTPADIEQAASAIECADAVSLDLEVPLETVEASLRLARRAGRLSVLDAGPPRPCPPEILQLADIVSPNQPELEALTGAKVRGVASVREAAERLLEVGARTVVVKLGSAGSLLVSRSRTRHFPAAQVGVVDPTGAGDAFTAALTVRLAAECEIEEAIGYANAAGALAVTRLGAQPSLPTREEVDAFLAQRRSAVVTPTGGPG